jgi:hypothetical protein
MAIFSAPLAETSPSAAKVRPWKWRSNMPKVKNVPERHFNFQAGDQPVIVQPLALPRIGIYSGSFDPVHAGHIVFALKAQKIAGLDEIYFVP